MELPSLSARTSSGIKKQQQANDTNRVTQLRLLHRNCSPRSGAANGRRVALRDAVLHQGMLGVEAPAARHAGRELVPGGSHMLFDSRLRGKLPEALRALPHRLGGLRWGSLPGHRVPGGSHMLFDSRHRGKLPEALRALPPGSEDSDGPRRSALRRLSGDVCVLVMCLATASSALDARGCGSLAFLAVCENLHALPSTHLPAAKCLQGFVAFPKTCPNGQLLPFVQAPSAKSLHNLVPAPPPTSLEFTVGGKGGATCAKVQALPFVQSPWAKCLHNFEVAEAFAEALPFPAPTDGP
eukprot:CAMPEP_0183599764 /NCGR_PEP_ID=MMETSP0371-20130417/179597_1 /TAXON_ID=268820 /ORGANISM="Peridinium aciculiferum, Strain PAER-2" /LENGTH=295 /DNA_ID=CAMNT_0025811835 /DNA_START=129 /DNA_END=1018 /DNA_ORIENTATION=+